MAPDQLEALRELRSMAARHALRARIARRAKCPETVAAHRNRMAALLEAREALKALWSRPARAAALRAFPTNLERKAA